MKGQERPVTLGLERLVLLTKDANRQADVTTSFLREQEGIICPAHAWPLLMEVFHMLLQVVFSAEEAIAFLTLVAAHHQTHGVPQELV